VWPRTGGCVLDTVPDVEPADALERIAYLLDRAREKPYKPRAYLRAAEVVRGLDDGELERRIAAGTLTELEHIGPKTAAVIVEAAAGDVPDYLRHLEEATGVTPGVGADLLAAPGIEVDAHSVGCLDGRRADDSPHAVLLEQVIDALAETCDHLILVLHHLGQIHPQRVELDPMLGELALCRVEAL